MEILDDDEYQGLHTVETLDNGVLHIRKEINVKLGGRTFKYLEEYDGGETFTKKVLDAKGKVLGEGAYELLPYADARHYYGYDAKGRQFKDGVYTGKKDKYCKSSAYYKTTGMHYMYGNHVSGDKIEFNFRDIIIAKLNNKGLVKEIIEIDGEDRVNRPVDEREIKVYKFDEKSERISVSRGGAWKADYSLYKLATYTPDGVLRKVSAKQHAWERGIRIGTEELYDKNERLQSSISYKDNKQDEATFYNSDGSVKEKVDCKKDLNMLLQVLAKTDNAEEAFDLIAKKCGISIPKQDFSDTYDSHGKIVGNYYKHKLLGCDVKHVKGGLFVIGAVFEDRTRGFIYGTADTGRRCTGKLVDIEKGEVLSDVNFGYGNIKSRDFIKMEDGKIYIDYQPGKKQFMIPEDDFAAVKSRVEGIVEKKNAKASTQEPKKSAGKVVKTPKIYE